MTTIHHMKRDEIEAAMKEVQPGFYQADLLPGSMAGVETYKCRLKAGALCRLKSWEDKAAAVFFYFRKRLCIGRRTPFLP